MNTIELIPPKGTARNYRHGYKTAGKYSPEYSIWMNMRARCTNLKNKRFHLYGARGISVCERWSNDFVNFLQDMGRRPSPKHSIERIDNDGDYTPDNCRWATTVEQARNRRSSRFITIKNEEKTLAEWCEIKGLPVSTVHARLKSGWGAERALSQPIRGRASKDGKTMHNATIFKSFPF